MSAPNTEGSLLRLARTAVHKCVVRLNDISGLPWGAQQEVFLDNGSEDAFKEFFDSDLEGHYGVWLTAARLGMFFLVMFPRQTGMRLTDAFTGPARAKLDLFHNREKQALAEVSNILIQTFAATLASAWKSTLILSVPEVTIDSQRDLFLAAFKKAAASGKLSASGLARLSCAKPEASCSIVFFLNSIMMDRVIETDSGR